MNITITPRRMRNNQKIYYTFEWGKQRGQRKASGIFTYVHPSTPIERAHNKEALRVLTVKRAYLLLDWQCIGTGLIPMHRLQFNFLDFYADYVERNKRFDYHHLPASFIQFKRFISNSFLSPQDLTNDLCSRFRQYLLGHYNTPANYFARFKRMVKAATQQGYFRIDPCADISVKSKKNSLRKEHLEAEEYIQLLKTPCEDPEVRDAFIFCCYTGLRWCDVKVFSLSHVKTAHCIVQKKTQVEHFITLHPVAKAILESRLPRSVSRQQTSPLFLLPTSEAACTVLATWCKNAGIDKHITWSCARLSFSILLQDALVDSATVSLLLGHTTSCHVYETYKRHRPKDQAATIALLPSPGDPPYLSKSPENIRRGSESAHHHHSSKYQIHWIQRIFQWSWRLLMSVLQFLKYCIAE